MAEIKKIDYKNFSKEKEITQEDILRTRDKVLYNINRRTKIELLILVIILVLIIASLTFYFVRNNQLKEGSLYAPPAEQEL